MSTYYGIEIKPYFASDERYPSIIGVRAEGDEFETAYVSKRELMGVLSECDKMRELTRDLWRFTSAACGKYPHLFDQPAQGGQMVQSNALESFRQRMEELGIEVDE